MKLRWAEPLVTTVGAALATALAATWRYRVQGWEAVAAARAAGRPIVYVLWHSRLLPLIYNRRREGIALLISRHRDGGYLADLCEGWGYRTVRGSSQRGGVAGLLGVIRFLQSGGEVGTTPDGPRGPAEQLKPGILVAAQHANAVVFAMGARTSRAWWVQSWDRLCVPKPFATIDVFYSPALEIGPGKDGLRRGVEEVEQALREVTYGAAGKTPEAARAP